MNTGARCWVLGAGVAASLGAGPNAALAQRFEVGTSAQMVTYRMKAGGPVDERGATYYGGAGALWIGGLKIGAEGLFGTVAGSAGESFALRATTLQVGARAGRFEFGGQAEARRRAAVRDTSLLRLIGAYGTFTPDFGQGFSGLASLAYYPMAHALNEDPINLALRTEVGARYTPASLGGRFSFYTSYRVFRLDYRAAGTAEPRLEQDAGMVLGISLSGGANR